MVKHNNSLLLQTDIELNETERKQDEADDQAIHILLLRLPTDVYDVVDSCQITNEMWHRIKKLKREDPLTSAMKLLTHSITQRYSTPRNNHLRSSSNIRNQAVAQADRVNIQRRNVRNDGRIARRSYNIQEESAVGSNVQKENGNVQRTLRTSSARNVTNVQCYNFSAKLCSGLSEAKSSDSKYFMKQMLLAENDKAGVILSNDHNDFLIANAAQLEDIKELSANICMMAIIQPTKIDFDEGQAMILHSLARVDIISKNTGYARYGNRNAGRHNRIQAANVGNGLVQQIKENNQNV
nr:hypothetical protein [Tanacetum cinerariifolium]